jgi:hypothetical protein
MFRIPGVMESSMNEAESVAVSSCQSVLKQVELDDAAAAASVSRGSRSGIPGSDGGDANKDDGGGSGAGSGDDGVWRCV